MPFGETGLGYCYKQRTHNVKIANTKNTFIEDKLDVCLLKLKISLHDNFSTNIIYNNKNDNDNNNNNNKTKKLLFFILYKRKNINMKLD